MFLFACWPQYVKIRKNTHTHLSSVSSPKESVFLLDVPDGQAFFDGTSKAAASTSVLSFLGNSFSKCLLSFLRCWPKSVLLAGSESGSSDSKATFQTHSCSGVQAVLTATFRTLSLVHRLAWVPFFPPPQWSGFVSSRDRTTIVTEGDAEGPHFTSHHIINFNFSRVFSQHRSTRTARSAYPPSF